MFSKTTFCKKLAFTTQKTKQKTHNINMLIEDENWKEKNSDWTESSRHICPYVLIRTILFCNMIILTITLGIFQFKHEKLQLKNLVYAKYRVLTSQKGYMDIIPKGMAFTIFHIRYKPEKKLSMDSCEYTIIHFIFVTEISPNTCFSFLVCVDKEWMHTSRFGQAPIKLLWLLYQFKTLISFKTAWYLLNILGIIPT